MSILSDHCIAAVDSRIAGKTAVDSIRFFTSQDHTNQVYVRNTLFWAADIDLSSISPWNSDSANTKAGVMVSPVHYICAAHYTISNGSTMRFVKMNGDVINRTVLGSTSLPTTSSNFPDINIGILNSPITDINIARVLPVTSAADIDALTVPSMALDQEEKGLIGDVATLGSTTIRFRSTIPNDNTRQAYAEYAISGDSGNPSFIIIDNQLTLLSVWTLGGSLNTMGQGAPITYYLTEIQDRMNSLSTTHSQPQYDLLLANVSLDPVTDQTADVYSSVLGLDASSVSVTTTLVADVGSSIFGLDASSVSVANIVPGRTRPFNRNRNSLFLLS